MKLLPMTQLSNDLFANYTCPKCHKWHTLTGYNDDYFFETVNCEPRRLTCECGTEFAVQWTHEGVKVFE